MRFCAGAREISLGEFNVIAISVDAADGRNEPFRHAGIKRIKAIASDLPEISRYVLGRGLIKPEP